jgi:hypothetical protein
MLDYISFYLWWFWIFLRITRQLAYTHLYIFIFVTHTVFMTSQKRPHTLKTSHLPLYVWLCSHIPVFLCPLRLIVCGDSLCSGGPRVASMCIAACWRMLTHIRTSFVQVDRVWLLCAGVPERFGELARAKFKDQVPWVHAYVSLSDVLTCLDMWCVCAQCLVLMFMSRPPILEMWICASWNRGESDISSVCFFVGIVVRTYMHTLMKYAHTHTHTHTHTQTHHTPHTHTHTHTHTHNAWYLFFACRV